MSKRTVQVTSVIAFIAVLLCIISVSIPLHTANAYAMELNNDECDEVFWKSISELYEGDNSLLTVAATKEIVYDIDLNELGFIYDFYANNEHGYAVIIDMDGQFEAIEFFFDASNPYVNVGQGDYRIYVSTMVYLTYDDGVYYFVDEDYALPENIISSMREIAFQGGDRSLGNYSEYVYYTNRSETKHELAKRHPGLIEVSGLMNACAPIAGGNLIQYWDRYKTNLIANYTPGTTIGNFYLYKEASATTDAMVTQLYSDMGTNGTGTTIAQFISGINTYCTRQGYTATFTSCMSNNSFVYTTAKQQLTAGNPIVLFLDTYTIGKITENDGYDLLSYKIGSDTHVMAGFGYKEVTYSLTNGGTRQDYYIAVGSGLAERNRGFFNINYNTQIDAAYSLVIS